MPAAVRNLKKRLAAERRLNTEKKKTGSKKGIKFDKNFIKLKAKKAISDKVKAIGFGLRFPFFDIILLTKKIFSF